MIIEAVTRDFDGAGIGNVSDLPEVESGNDLVLHNGRLKSLPLVPFIEGDEWVYNTDAEAYMYMSEHQDMGQRAIFDTWARTDGQNFYAAGVAPAGQATGWRFDTANQLFRCTVNSSRPLTILSLSRQEDFEFSATLASTNSDDDAIGLVIAADQIGDDFYALVAIRTCGGLYRTTYAIGYLHPGSSSPDIILNSNTGSNPSGWSRVTTDVEIVRTGNNIKVRSTNFNSVAYLEDLDIDLDSDPRLHKFKGPMRYGFYSHSQSDSQYRNVNQPFSGARAFSLESGHAWENIDGKWVDLGPVDISNYVGAPRSVVNPDTGLHFYIYEGM